MINIKDLVIDKVYVLDLKDATIGFSDETYTGRQVVQLKSISNFMIGTRLSFNLSSWLVNWDVLGDDIEEIYEVEQPEIMSTNTECHHNSIEKVQGFMHNTWYDVCRGCRKEVNSIMRMNY